MVEEGHAGDGGPSQVEQRAPDGLLRLDVRLIAAVGRQGQLGLGGRLPWPKEKGDLPHFRKRTSGGVLIAGAATAKTLPKGFPFYDETRRKLYTWYGMRSEQPAVMLARVSRENPGKTIWIIGGAKTYAAFYPFVHRVCLTQIDYDGPADVSMPQLWRDNNE